MTSLVRKWFSDNGRKMYSTYNDGKSVAERFIKTLKQDSQA